MSPPAFLPRPRLFDVLKGLGYRIVGPVPRDGAIVYEEISSASELPWEGAARQAAGSFCLEAGAGERCFAWANGPQALKPLAFAPVEPLWRMERKGAGFEVQVAQISARPTAVIGVRACDLVALALQDRHFLGPYADGHCAARREDLLLIAVNCTHPAATCFCASTGD